jgi:hypothetical protein
LLRGGFAPVPVLDVVLLDPLRLLSPLVPNGCSPCSPFAD